ncbi:MAG: hypothetical protein ABL970_08035, partial [Nitrospira sp.]
MRFPMRSGVSLCLTAVLFGCSPSYRAGLPPQSPFADSVALAAELLPQGVAVGDVSGHSAVLWVRTDGPAMVHIEWAPASAWDAAEKMGTAVWPLLRTNRVTTAAESD